MATVYLPLPIEAAIFRSAAFPNIVQRPGIGAGSPMPVRGLAFDAASQEEAFFLCRPQGIVAAGLLNLDIDWYADTASSGSVVWGAQVLAITPGVDTISFESLVLGTQLSVTDTHLGTTGKRLHRARIPNLDPASVANNDLLAVKLSRLASNGSDTMTGDAIVVALQLDYLDA